jgi:flagellar hook-associated protein 1 FlgK
MSLAFLTGVMSTSTSGMRAAQAQLDVISRNVANAGTPGYTRKEAPLETILADNSASGVTTGEVRRTVSRSLLQELRSGAAAAAALRVNEDYLARLERAFGTPGEDSSIASTLGKIGDAFRSLATEPSSAILQQQAIQRANNFAIGVNELTQTIQTLRLEAESTITEAIETANTALREIDEINRKVSQQRGLGRATADLEDRRDTLLRRLSGVIDIRTFERASGEVVVTTRSGRELLDAEVGQLSFNPKPAISADMEYADGDLSGILIEGTDISAEIAGGQLRGLLDVRDSTMVGAQRSLDELAARMAQNFALCDLDLFSYAALRTVDATVTAAAAVAKGGTSLEVSSAANLAAGMNLRFANHATTYVVTAIAGTTLTIAPANGAPAGVDVAIPAGARMVFAAQPGDARTGFAGLIRLNPTVVAETWRLRDGTSAIAIGTLAQDNAIPRAVIDSFERVQPFSSSGGATGGQTLTAFAGSLIVAQASARATAKETLAARENLNEQFDQRFSAESGVNVDRELALMMEIQTSYAASAKVLQATRDLIDALMSAVR